MSWFGWGSSKKVGAVELAHRSVSRARFGRKARRTSMRTPRWRRTRPSARPRSRRVSTREAKKEGKKRKEKKRKRREKGERASPSKASSAAAQCSRDAAEAPTVAELMDKHRDAVDELRARCKDVLEPEQVSLAEGVEEVVCFCDVGQHVEELAHALVIVGHAFL